MSNRCAWFRLCTPNTALRVVGWILIAAGGLLLIIFLPLRFWCSLLGLALVVLGFLLRSNF